MLCENIKPMLSEFFDGVLDPDASVQVSQHLGQCIQCRKEFNSISALHNRLNALGRMPAPDYLRSLVQHRLAREPLRIRIQNELERYWSIIRTTEGIWYATRALGTVMASMFFLLVSTAVTPLYIQADTSNQGGDSVWGASAYSPKINVNVIKRVGIVPAQIPVKRAGRSGPAAINELYLLKYGQGLPLTGKDDTFSVYTTVDSTGNAKVEHIVQYPLDHALLAEFNQMISSARFRPASENGHAVQSPLVFTVSKVFVSD